MKHLKPFIALLLIVSSLLLYSCASSDDGRFEFNVLIDENSGERVANLVYYAGRDYEGDEYFCIYLMNTEG